jgi:hypothetical protein
MTTLAKAAMKETEPKQRNIEENFIVSRHAE